MITKEVYVDGSCRSGRGGWAWTDGERHASGSVPDSTNQRMEMTAALMAIEAHAEPIIVYSDSAYVVDCFKQRWYVKWQQRSWLNSVGKPVANQDLWERLIELVEERKTRFVKVRGHSGVPLNEEADRLANAAAGELWV